MGAAQHSAVHQRGMTWKMKRFVDEVCEPAWFYDDLVGRVGAVFTAGGGAGGAGGGAEAAQLDMLTNLAACGMVLVTLPKDTPGAEHGGIQWGPTIRTTTDDMRSIDPDRMDESSQLAFFHHGANVVRVASRLRGLALAAANHMPTPRKPSQPTSGGAIRRTARTRCDETPGHVGGLRAYRASQG